MKRKKGTAAAKKSVTPEKPAKKSTPSQPPRPPKPAMKWQTGDYERHANFRFTLPYQFLLLCRLMEVTPDQVLSDFMDNLSCGSWKREGRDKAKERLIEYFTESGYGQHYYSVEEIGVMFRELDAIGMLWPNNSKMKLIDLHAKWRNKYYKYWFKKWWRKPRRKDCER